MEPAPVDQQFDTIETIGLLVAGDDLVFLGASENIGFVADRGTGRHHDRLSLDIAGLEDIGAGGCRIGKAGIDVGVGLGQHGGRPVFVGNAEPAGGRGEIDLLLVLQIGIFAGNIIVRAQDANRAFVLDEEVLHLRVAVADNARIGEQGHVACAGVFDGLGDGEEIEFVDRKGAAENQALTIVEAQRYRRLRGQRGIVAFDRPDALAAGQCDGGARSRGPALLDEIGVAETGRLEQRDNRRVRIDGLAILLELQVVDTGAGQVDRAIEVGCGNGHPVAGRQGTVAVGKDLRRVASCCGSGCGRGAVGIGLRDGELFSLGLLAGGDLGLALSPLELRAGNEELPAEQHNHAEHDGEDHIAIVRIHGLGFRWPRPGVFRLSPDLVSCTRAIRPPRSATILAKGWLRASRRASRT